MNNNDIADRIEEIIGRMFYACSELELKPKEYSLYYNPSKNPSWFIQLFFADNSQLRKALESGRCYEIHTFMQTEFENSDISEIEKIIFFEKGLRPTEQIKLDEEFEKLLKIQTSLFENTGKINQKNCHCCGHDNGNHLMFRYDNEEDITLAHGWMMCPEESCNCFFTWGTNYLPEKE